MEPFIVKNAPKWVVTDRIEPGVAQPEYCIHGRATCIRCDDWVWLGDQTYKLVASGEAAPICRQCAGRLIPEGTPTIGHINDHRRADGPH